MNFKHILILIVGVGAIIWYRDAHPSQKKVASSLSDRQKIEVTVGNVELEVEVVKEESSIRQGLSGRDQIGSDGMLFVLPERSKTAFWMKEMEFDLDIVWIDKDRIIDITQNVPKPAQDQTLSQLELYAPAKPANMVLELNAGDSQRYGLEVGDKFSFH